MKCERTEYRAWNANARSTVHGMRTHGVPCMEREDVLSELEQKLNALGAQIEETWRGL
jgi:hypothetical protein